MDQAGLEGDDYDRINTYVNVLNEVKSTSTLKYGAIVAADKVTLARTATETRPKNIKVVFLMKCWHQGK